MGELQADVDGTVLHQDPYSPHPREGDGLSDRFPLDSNVNPKDAKQDQDRIQANLRLVHPVGEGRWVTTASYAHTDGSNTRGFLREDFADDGVTPNADGFRQQVDIDDFYFDSYYAPAAGAQVDWLVGADWMYGNGSQQSKNFEYAVLPDGSNAPNSHDLPVDETTSTGGPAQLRRPVRPGQLATDRPLAGPGRPAMEPDRRAPRREARGSHRAGLADREVLRQPERVAALRRHRRELPGLGRTRRTA